MQPMSAMGGKRTSPPACSQWVESRHCAYPWWCNIASGRSCNVHYLFLRLRSIIDAIDRKVDGWLQGARSEDEVINQLTRQMEREAMEKLAEWYSAGGDWGGE